MKDGASVWVIEVQEDEHWVADTSSLVCQNLDDAKREISSSKLLFGGKYRICKYQRVDD